MKHNERDGISFECDSCDEILETGTKVWGDAKACLDREGWQAQQVGHDWIHCCPKHYAGR